MNGNYLFYLYVIFRRIMLSALCILSFGFTVPTATAMQSYNSLGKPPTLADGIIVKYRDTSGAKKATAQARVQTFANKQKLPLTYQRSVSGKAHLLSLGKRQSWKSVEKIAKELRKESNVLYAEPNAIMWPGMTPNDTHYSSQWHYYETTGGIRAPQAWDLSAGVTAVVAVIDTGYRPHSDLASMLLPGYDFVSNVWVANDGDGRDDDASDPGDWMLAGECGGGWPLWNVNSSWHGTHVAGTVAALTRNNKGVAGVAWRARVVPVRVLGRCGGSLADIADGVRWAAGLPVPGAPDNPNPAHVINMSIWGSGYCGSVYQDAITDARNSGTTIVTIAGNADELSSYLSHANASNYQPGNCAGVITVAATDRSGNKADYSGFGDVVDLAAPGGELEFDSYGNVTNDINGVYSTHNTGLTTPGDDSYAFYQGTSMAAPHVAGVAAMLHGLKSSLTPDEVENILESTARNFPGTCLQCGAGIVDAFAAANSITDIDLRAPTHLRIIPFYSGNYLFTWRDNNARALQGTATPHFNATVYGAAIPPSRDLHDTAASIPAYLADPHYKYNIRLVDNFGRSIYSDYEMLLQLRPPENMRITDWYASNYRIWWTDVNAEFSTETVQVLWRSCCYGGIVGTTNDFDSNGYSIPAYLSDPSYEYRLKFIDEYNRVLYTDYISR